MDKFKVATDIGTTTVAVCLINKEGEILSKDGFLNGQRIFGSDVISRITNSVKGDNLAKMREIIINDIGASIEKLVKSCKSSGDESCDISISDYVSDIYITANTTMAAIISGLKPDTLGVHPFTMPFDSLQCIEIRGVKAHVFPGASAFIGADVLSGAVYLALSDGELLIDLGTNGEMVLKCNGRYHAASAACGPAFENCTRVQGAYGKTTLNALAYLIKTGRITPDGIISGDEPEITHNGLRINADIIRSIQLAISAVYTTLTRLVNDAGPDISDIKKLYIAGGFGFHMSLSDASYLGLIPEKLMEKTVICGNTSLEGAVLLATDKKALVNFDEIKHNVCVHQYGGDEGYNEEFIKNLTLGRR